MFQLYRVRSISRWFTGRNNPHGVNGRWSIGHRSQTIGVGQPFQGLQGGEAHHSLLEGKRAQMVKADLPLLMKQVFFVQAMMPAMTQTPILAGAYGADSEYAGLVTALTTALSLATIPLCMLVIGGIF